MLYSDQSSTPEQDKQSIDFLEKTVRIEKFSNEKAVSWARVPLNQKALEDILNYIIEDWMLTKIKEIKKKHNNRPKEYDQYENDYYIIRSMYIHTRRAYI